MIQLSEKDRRAKEAVLQQLLEVMDDASSSKLKGLKDKKPAVTEMSITALKPKDEADDEDKGLHPLDFDAPHGDEGEPEDGEDEPSEEEKAQIAALYHKFCK